MDSDWSRRDFLKATALLAAGSLVPIQSCTTGGSEPSPPSAVIEDWLNLLADQAQDQWLSLHAPTVIWYPQAGGVPVRGRDLLEERIRQSAVANEGVQATAIRLFENGEWICAQYVLRSSGTSTPSKCGVFRIADGLVTEWFEYGCQTDPDFLQPEGLIEESDEDPEANIRIIKRWAVSANERDWASYRELHHDSAKGYFVGFREPFRDLDEFAAEFSRYFDPRPQTKMEMVRSFGQGAWVCAQFRVSSFSVCEVFQIEARRIAQYFDYVSQSQL